MSLGEGIQEPSSADENVHTNLPQKVDTYALQYHRSRHYPRADPNRRLSRLIDDIPSTGMPPNVSRLVESPLIADCSLHKHLERRFHPYFLPFAILYPIWYYVYNYRYDEYLGSEEWTFVTIVSLITTQSLLWLSGHWSISVRAYTRFTKAKGLADAEAIKIIPAPNQGAAQICDITNTTYPNESHVETSFVFQKKKFIFNVDRKVFREVVFPVDSNPAIAEYQTSKGLTSEEDLSEAQRLYGFNRFDIPIPAFLELFKEHAVAPFFVFQIFCVGLWCLDEYWYYSLFTGFMLVAFESTVVFQRQKTLNEFRTMSIKPYPINVYRLNKWIEVQTDELFPNDLISINRTKEDSGVPCDVLLVKGSCIVNEAMLTGESTPLLKESIELRSKDEALDLEGLDKNALLSGGTKVLQVTRSTNDTGSLGSQPPDDGIIGIVLRTGFETQQGSLVRTMIYSTERVSANNLEALLFILFLLVFAIAASWYVWTHGVLEDRPKKKLLLDCILIVTSVVPPELPMELSLAVNSSLAALSKQAIFCTEPFRIPFAGRVDVCCFDKTGTLTEEDLVVEGVADLSRTEGGVRRLISVQEAQEATTLVLATAHSVVKLDDGTTVGDPMERATLKSIGWTIGPHESVLPPAVSEQFAGMCAVIKRRFQFNSVLKRQCTISCLIKKKSGSPKMLVSVKGAPETIMTMLAEVPSEYESTYKHFTRAGSRVIALASRIIDSNMSQDQINHLERNAVEDQLTFVGFLVFSCPLKPDAKATVVELNESSHRVIMITGDNALTACHVAREVEIVDRDVMILDVSENHDGQQEVVGRTIDDQKIATLNPSKSMDAELLAKYDLCVTGPAFSKFIGLQGLNDLIRHAWIYARVSPLQKEIILNELKSAGYTTLMCGDGTNDVGALKQAHVGVALLNGSEDDLQKIAEHAKTTRLKAMYEKQIEMLARWNRPPPPCPQAIAHLYPPGPSNPHRQKALEAMGKSPQEILDSDKQMLATISRSTATTVGEQKGPTTPGQSMVDNMLAQMGDLEDEEGPPTIKLGDASCAAPFTSKLAHVGAIGNILRQGRCTLVATIQMYKILALNCLISAYSLSVLYLDGIKFGDVQVTISGMLMSVCFLCISRAKPLGRLSKERPHPGIFNIYIIGSILAQFAVHCATLIFISQYIQRTHPKEPKIDLEAKFEPSLLNSGIYLLQLTQQISTFSINYQGRPFRESIRENKYMYYGLVGVGALAFSCSTEFVPEINQALRLVKFSDRFKFVMTSTMALDYILCMAFEQIFKYFFADSVGKPITDRRPNSKAITAA